jgi:malonyl-CoA decarboxylase
MAAPSWLDQVGGIAERGRAILRLRRLDNLERECRRLIEQRGEATSIALAAAVVDAIERMDEAETESFLRLLLDHFSADAAKVEAEVERWRLKGDRRALDELWQTAEPPRQELFRRLNVAPGGTRAIVRLRARLLELLEDDPELEPVDRDLRHLLGSWFNRGFLQIEEISWRTPATILEQLIEYDAVHAIAGWQDLRRRLAADRRCFAFFHPSLPDVPLIFVEVALTRGLATKIGPLIDPEREVGSPQAADTAIFYSINSTQAGLRGISFGSFLIKQVVTELSSRLLRLRRYATLSPLPSFAAALRARGQAALSDQRAPHTDSARRELERLALAYLLHARRDGRAADPVANFHLANGARLERINTDADLSEHGRQSCGVMVNYLYEPDRLELNHERYVERGEISLSRDLSGKTRGLRW